MLVRQGENRSESVSGKTLNGLFINAFLAGATNNVPISDTSFASGNGFDPSNVNLKVILTRREKDYVIVHDNLGILAHYQTIKNGGSEWFKGTILQAHGTSAKQQVVRTLFLDFGGHINLDGSDKLTFELSVNRNTFGSEVDANSSYIQVQSAFSIGKEQGIPQTRTRNIQANSVSENFVLGNNLMKFAVINVDSTPVTQQIVTNVAITSDRYKQSFTFNDLVNLQNRWYAPQPYAKHGGQVATIERVFPQTFLIHDGELISQAAIDMTFDGSKVSASKNFVVQTNLLSSKEIVLKAAQRAEKHAIENIQALPDVI